jgi:hypothetical protein
MVILIYSMLVNRKHQIEMDESYLRSIETDNLTFKRTEKSFYEKWNQITECLCIRYNFTTTRGQIRKLDWCFLNQTTIIRLKFQVGFNLGKPSNQ